MSFTPLSCYILTKNSERRLAQVLASLQGVADEVLVLDSGSTDATLNIAASFGCRVQHRDFDNFRDQRVAAEALCSHDWVLALDSDEVLSPELASHIQVLKERGFADGGASAPDGYALRRDWYFTGERVRNFYPVRTPEHIVRLFNHRRIGHRNSRVVHEQVNTDGATIRAIDLPLQHFSCDSVQDLYAKLPLYARLSAQDLHARGERAGWVKQHLYPWLIWFRWHVLYQGFRDGAPGRVLGRYVRDTVRTKYQILRDLS